MDLTGILIFLGIAAVIGSIVAGSIWLEKKRQKELQQLAESMSLQYVAHGDESMLAQLASFQLFNQGRSRKMTNLVQGETDELKIAIFDYQFTTGSGKQSTTHRQSVAVLQSNQLLMPQFAMRPENMLDFFGRMFGQQDIDFETHHDFSRLYVLQGPNEQEIRQFFRPAIIDFFETHPGLSIEARPGALIYYRRAQRIKPADLKLILNQVYEVYGAIIDNVAATRVNNG